jgi:hypothetical protein
MCGAEAGFFKEVCSDCSDTAPENCDPAPTDSQQGGDEQRPKSENSPQVPNESDEVPQVTQDEPSFGGQFLRFVGMAMIIVAVILGFFGLLGVWQLILFALIIGLAGAALHFKGRKLAPEKIGASAAGGVAGTLGIGALILFFIASAISSCLDPLQLS